MQEVKNTVKKRWTPQEDHALRQIKQNLKYKSWNLISKKMATQFGFYGRSQKQCRDRYQNYLKGREQSFTWTEREQKKMFELFAKQGSRWELISTYFTNMYVIQSYQSKGIHIKNKFYTRVRKAVRQINSVIQFYFAKKYSPFQFTIISKLVSLVSRNVQESKYEHKQPVSKVQNDTKQKTQNENISNCSAIEEILYEMIELTNNQGFELFPELGLKTSPQTEKKKLFKKLIKKLKLLQDQYQNEKNASFSLYNHPLSPLNDFFIQHSEINAHVKVQTKNDNTQNMLRCEYKLITDDRQKQKSFFPIISRIKRLKFTSQRQAQKQQKSQALHFQQIQEKAQKRQNPVLDHNMGYYEHKETFKYPQFYFSNLQHDLYMGNNCEIGNIQLFYNSN